MTRPEVVSRLSVTVPAAVLCVQLLITASGWTQPADGARILAVETLVAHSHWNFMRGVLRAMVQDGGHQVTVYTPLAGRGMPATNDYVEVDTLHDFDEEFRVAGNMNATLMIPAFSRPSFTIPFFANISRHVCDLMDRWLANRGGPGDTFDLFVTETFSCECVSRAAHRLGVPLIYTIPSPLIPWIETSAFGHYANPAHESHMMSAYSIPDTFYRRAHNLWLHAYTAYLHYRHALSSNGKPPFPVKPSLMFVNTHYVTEVARPVPPNRIDVGGIHLTKPKPLSADILEFIEDSPHGVIYFSLSSIVAMSTLPANIQKVFIDTFAVLPQRVLMKYEEEMKDKPKNVMIRKWLPQRSILLHPKVKLFIGHGGISGVYEALDAGIPVLGFPLFYDQPRNIDNLVNAGMAISLDLMSVTKDQFLKAITDMVNNKTYAQNAKTVSERFKDRPMTPSESVVYWTNYVIRHKGAPHLKSHALNLTWYEYFLLDVIAVALLNILLVFYVTFKVFRFIKKCIFKSSQNSKSKSE